MAIRALIVPSMPAWEVPLTLSGNPHVRPKEETPIPLQPTAQDGVVWLYLTQQQQ